MGDKIDIFESLKSWDIAPPKYLFKKIWNILTRQHNTAESAEAIGNLETPADDTEEYSNLELDAFRSLQNHSIAPPSFSSLKIRELITENATKPTTKVFQLKYFIRAAAAILILVSGIWIFYNKSQVKEDSNDSLASTAIASKNTTPAIASSIKGSSVLPSAPLHGNARVIAISGKRNSIGNKGRIKTSKDLNSEEGRLVNNDILGTLVNYHYTEYLPLLTEIKKNNRINLGQFSYVNISDKMNGILQKMYGNKKNGKPTRKAKKLRITMEKWKKRDEKHFDANTNNNPLDVIDLSEFILK